MISIFSNSCCSKIISPSPSFVVSSLALFGRLGMEENSKSSPANLPQIAVPPSDDVSQVVRGFISTDKNMRCAAEEQFAKVPADMKPNFLLRLCKSSEATEDLRCDWLDRLIPLLKNIIHTWNSDNLTPFTEHLIEYAVTEKSERLSGRLIDLLVQVTKHSMDLNSGVQPSPNIISFMKICTATEWPTLKRIAISVIQQVPNLFGKCIADTRNLVEKCLMDREETIRSTGLKTFFAVINENTIDSFSSLLPLTFQMCEETVVVNEKREEDNVDVTRGKDCSLCDNKSGEKKSMKGQGTPFYCPIASLSQLAIKYPLAVRPYRKEIVNVCSRAVSGTSDRMRRDLTNLMEHVLKDNTTNIDAETSSKIANFILNCASSTTSDVKRAALHVVDFVPLSFGGDFQSPLLDLLKNRLNDDSICVRLSACNVFTTVLDTYSSDNEYSMRLAVLFSRIIEMCEAQAESVDRKYDEYYGPLAALVDVIKICLDRLRPLFTRTIAVCAKFLRKLNTRKEENKPLTEEQTNVLSNLIIVIRSIFNDNTVSVCKKEVVIDMCNQLCLIVYSEISDALREECFELMNTADSKMDNESSAQSWSEFYRQLSNNTHYSRKIITLQMIQRMPRVADSNAFSIVYAVHDLLEDSFVDGNAEIRSNALRAYELLSYSCINNANEETIRSLRSLVPSLLKLAVTGNRQDALNSIDCSTAYILDPHVSNIIEAFCKVINDTAQSANLRDSVMKSLVLLCEKVSRKREEEKIGAHLVSQIFSSCLLVMSEFDDDISVWENEDYTPHQFSPGRLTREEQSLFNIFAVLNRELAIPSLFCSIDRILTHDDWRKKHAALMGMAVMRREKENDNVMLMVKRITPLLKDPNSRVRCDSALALLQITHNVQPSLQKILLETVVPSLLQCFADTTVPRVSSQAGAVLSQLINECTQAVSPHLDTIMQNAVAVLEATYQKLITEDKPRCLKQTIELIRCVNETDGTHFAKFFDRLIRSMKHIYDVTVENDSLHMASFECFSLIASAGGREKCLADVTQVMRPFIEDFDSILNSSMGATFVSSFIRLVPIMGHYFDEYIDVVMTPIIQSIQWTNAVINEDGQVYQQRYGHHGMWQRKRMACQIVVPLADVLGASFFPYVMQMGHLAIAHLSMIVHREWRAWAPDMFPALLSSVNGLGGREMAARLWPDYSRVLMETLEKESRTWRGQELCIKIIRSLTKCMEQVENISMEDRRVIGEMMQNLKERHEERKMGKIRLSYYALFGDDDDDEDGERMNSTRENEMGLWISAALRLLDTHN